MYYLALYHQMVLDLCKDTEMVTAQIFDTYSNLYKMEIHDMCLYCTYPVHLIWVSDRRQGFASTQLCSSTTVVKRAILMHLGYSASRLLRSMSQSVPCLTVCVCVCVCLSLSVLSGPCSGTAPSPGEAGHPLL